jgi:HEAT repeat protein
VSSEDFRRVQRALRGAGLPADDFGRFINISPAKLRNLPDDFVAEYFGALPVFDGERSVPVLIELLPTLNATDAIDAAASHLTTKYAKPQAAVPLMDLFERLPTRDYGSSAKWAVGRAIGAVTTKEHRDRLLRLSLDPSHGSDRQEIVYRIGYFKKDDEVTTALLRLLADEDVAFHAMTGLRRQIGAAAVRPYIAPLVDHDSERIRQQAIRELRTIDKRLARPSR